MKKILSKFKRISPHVVLLILLFGISSCKKETPNENLVKVKSILSTNSPDYLSRLSEI